MTPAATTRSTMGIERAARTIPRSVAEPVSPRTAKAIAIEETLSPTTEAVWAR
jgi:hypothetical protein